VLGAIALMALAAPLVPIRRDPLAAVFAPLVAVHGVADVTVLVLVCGRTPAAMLVPVVAVTLVSIVSVTVVLIVFVLVAPVFPMPAVV